jgi:uncharacterized membrane protein HdeD (DUF308 family)
MKVLGILLIIVGIVMLIFRGFNFTQEKKVADIGPLEINKQEEKTVAWPMYAGGIAVAAGVLILVAGGKRNRTGV